MRYAVLASATFLAVGAGVFLTGCKSGGVDKAAGTQTASCLHTEACAACSASEAPNALPNALVGGIETAHGKDAYDAMGAAGKVVRVEFDVDFGGGDLLAGTMWFDTAVGQTRMELDNGAVVVFDGDMCWVSGDAPEIPYGYRFHALTWPYFVAAPFKLSDPGVSHALIEEAPLTANRTSEATKMTFGDGVGDAPDDWYVVFPVPQDGSLAALAYIVTYDMPAAYAEQKPSIVFYTQPETVEGATFATELIFHFWDKQAGVQGEDPKGVMSVSEIAFVDPPADAFVAFDGAMESALPSMGDAEELVPESGEVGQAMQIEEAVEDASSEVAEMEAVAEDAGLIDTVEPTAD